jgi:hypothetical protein
LSAQPYSEAQEDEVSTGRKITAQPKTSTHPVRPGPEKVSIAASHKAIAKRFPKVLAELAK